ncbi:hypothetical protein ACLOJK_009338 [Asimina triloba]
MGLGSCGVAFGIGRIELRRGKGRVGCGIDELSSASGGERDRAGASAVLGPGAMLLEDPQRKPLRNRKVKACFIDCSSKCETTCKLGGSKFLYADRVFSL